MWLPILQKRDYFTNYHATVIESKAYESGAT